MVRKWVFTGSMAVMLGTTLLAMDPPGTPRPTGRAAVVEAALTITASPRARDVMQRSPNGQGYVAWSNKEAVLRWFVLHSTLEKYKLDDKDLDIVMTQDLLQRYQQIVVDLQMLSREGITDLTSFEAELQKLREEIGHYGDERRRLLIQAADDQQEEKEPGCLCC